MPRLAGKLALITGGNSGIGLATAKAFVAEGARVAITGRDRDTLEAARRLIGNDTLAIQSDTADLKAIDTLFATIQEEFGALDILFANAGIGSMMPVENTSEDDFDRIFDVNVKGLFFTVQKALPLLRNGASIILNGSIAIRTGRVGFSVYAASKAAVRTFARNFSAEFVSRGIRVNVVSPGPIDTPIFWREQRGQKEVAALRQRIEADVPLGRMGKPEEIAQAVVFLASDESSFMLGTEIILDGGVTATPFAAPSRL
jgi:NAD(P)-dependent dehydrogenase (short-subunit alcohol dehydrogenase family)